MALKNYAIVGIDPGATYGIAIIGLSGRKMELCSTSKGFSEAARLIEERCTPSLVACDTNPAPEAALRLASYFSCRLFVPRESMREEEKNAVAKGASARDSHQRDSYSAAVFAWRLHQNRLRQIDALSGLAEEEKERVKHLLLRGVRVQDAFLLLREPGKGERQNEGERKLSAPSKPVSPEELRARLEFLARQNANLRMANDRLEEEKAALMQRLRLLENGVRKTLMREGEYRRLRHQLQQSLARLSERKGKRQAHGKGSQPPQQGKAQPQKAHSEGINSLGEPNLDLERLVEEYRKGRKNFM